ncbi:hypothetical protein R70211_05388 [Paraburkholderia domus]|uniref:Uncharacterized protein n=1 Tax=Paraburkholderia domus TaxID=2793075 RepID=A0A9N8R2F6_9BURK|nr:hypothetical protein R70211_05388 [Paraburkholderia domus]
MLTLVDSVLTAWLVAYSSEPLTASVLVALIRPAATFVIWRSAPDAPTLTTLAGDVPATLYDVPPTVTLEVGVAAAVTEPEPKATSLALTAVAPEPSATAPVVVAVDVLPRASEPVPVATFELPSATAPVPLDVLLAPTATAPVPVALFGSPIATAPLPLAVC